MKKLLLLSVIVLFCSYAGNLFAAPIPVNVFSSYFSISGSIEGEDYSSFSPYSASYDDSGSIPLANGVNYGNYYNGGSASSQAGFFYVNAKAGGGGNGPNSALAVADVLFQPLSPMTQFTISYQGGLAGGAGGEYSGYIELKDLTDGIQIFSKGVPYSFWNGADGSYLIDYPLQTNNVYELYLSAQADSYYDWQYVSIWTNDISAVVPEPTTMLLLGIGLMGLARVRRKLIQ